MMMPVLRKIEGPIIDVAPPDEVTALANPTITLRYDAAK